MSLNRSRIGVSLPMLNQPYERYPEFASLAEDAGFDSVWDYEFFRNPFITHALNARATNRIQLGTGIATAAPRTPFEMANAIAAVGTPACWSPRPGELQRSCDGVLGRALWK